VEAVPAGEVAPAEEAFTGALEMLAEAPADPAMADMLTPEIPDIVGPSQASVNLTNPSVIGGPRLTREKEVAGQGAEKYLSYLFL